MQLVHLQDKSEHPYVARPRVLLDLGDVLRSG